MGVRRDAPRSATPDPTGRERPAGYHEISESESGLTDQDGWNTIVMNGALSGFWLPAAPIRRDAIERSGETAMLERVRLAARVQVGT